MHGGQDVMKVASPMDASYAALVPTVEVQGNSYMGLEEGSMKELGSIAMGCSTCRPGLEVGMGRHTAARPVGASDTHWYRTQMGATRSDCVNICLGGFPESLLSSALSKDSSHRIRRCPLCRW